MNVGPAVMVVSDRDRPVTVPIRVGNIFRCYMDVSRVMIVICFDQSDSGPVGCMGEVVPRLRQPVQVYRR